MSERPVFYFPRMLPFNYRVEVFKRLNRRLGGRLFVCSGAPPQQSSLRSITDAADHGYTLVHIPNFWLYGDRVHWQPFRRVFRTYGPPAVVMAEESPRTLTQPLLMRTAHRHGAGRILWGHFSSNNRPFSPDHWADRYRIRQARRVEACVCYTEAIAEMLRPFVPDERLFVARNTLDTDTLFALDEALAREGKAAVRRRLGLPSEAPVLVFIGRLVGGKGTDLLLDVVRLLQAHTPVHLLVIGDGPERAAMERRVTREALRHVRFLGAIKAWADSAPYLFASDVMLQPGYLGLSVNHAFAFGLPVVSQAAPPGGGRFHSPEVSYVEPGRNGMLTPFGDVAALCEAVRYVLAHQASFSEQARSYARTHLRIDQMVDGLEHAIRYAEDPAHRLSP